MRLPSFLARLAAKPAPQAATTAGRELARRRHTKERNRIIDKANEMAAAMGRAPIPRRPE